MSLVHSYSQSNQDIWIAEIFQYKRGGYFVDVGAHNGVLSSNTLALENELGWNGLCIEANPQFYQELISVRPHCVHAAVTSFNGEIGFAHDHIDNQSSTIVPAKTLSTILRDHGAPVDIDYISIDVEGGEVNVLLGMDFQTWNVSALTIEHNSYSVGEAHKKEIMRIMNDNGFHCAIENVPCLDTNPAWYMKPYEDWYLNTKLMEGFVWKNYLI